MLNEPAWTAEYKAKVRDFMERNGTPVLFAERHYDWEPVDHVSTYGWTDFEMAYHIAPHRRKDKPCKWIVPPGAKLTERTYSQFTDTFSPNNDEVGVNVRPAHCACGKYTDVTLRWVGSVTDLLHYILGVPTELEVEL